MLRMQWQPCLRLFTAQILSVDNRASPSRYFRRLFVGIRTEDIFQQRGHLGQKGPLMNLGRVFSTWLIWHMQISLPTPPAKPQLWLPSTSPPFPCSSAHSTRLTGKHSGDSSAEAVESGANSALYCYSIPDQVLINVFYSHYLRVTNKWVLIPLTRLLLFEEVFACLLSDFRFPHWTLPGFNHFSSSYFQTCHYSCSCSPIFFLLNVFLKQLC